MDAEAADWVDLLRLPNVPANEEQRLPEKPVGRDSQKALAEHDKARDAQDTIGSQIVDLNPISIHDTTNKIVDGEPETPWKELHKADAFPIARRGEYLFSRSAHGRLVRRRQQPLDRKSVV